MAGLYTAEMEAAAADVRAAVADLKAVVGDRFGSVVVTRRGTVVVRDSLNERLADIPGPRP